MRGLPLKILRVTSAKKGLSATQTGEIMKIRIGFVSNSSSSSFAIPMRQLSLEQLCKILNHATWGTKLGIAYAESDNWHISMENGVLYADTYMDNFDMGEFLEKIGVPQSAIHWGEKSGEVNERNDYSEIENCDPDCDNCQMRYICYTNRSGNIK